MPRIAGLLLSAALAGCAQPTVEPDRFYRLLPPAPAALPAPLLPGTLVVRRFSADGLLGERALAYAPGTPPGALLQYNYHLWSESPGLMLQSVVVQALRAAGVARLVVTPALGVEGDFVLVGRIRRLEHLAGEAPAVAVALELGLVARRGTSALAVTDVEVTLPVNGAGIDAAVRAMSEAVGQILTRFVAELPRH